MKSSFKAVDQELPIGPKEGENCHIEDYCRCCQLHSSNPCHWQQRYTYALNV